ncbi:hypothetical protein [Clostridium baratii]|uniref:hypothetical protein n=1 Tax=Clostridium baratii TaxID=1561 RepID=UPI0005F2792F|nr:hypothetical protein [Clostridium baratii]KJU73181.1 hypothetical protein UC77_00565 [Clostridium baratii]
MRKIRKKNLKKGLAISLIFFSGALIITGCGNNIKKQMDKAVNDINSGQYSDAKNELDIILKEDSSNSEAKLLISIIDNFENAKRLFENKEYIKANEEISKIPAEYSDYNIKDDITSLKNDINKKLDEIKQIDNKINELSNLINDGNLDDASKKINEFKGKELTETQKKKIDDLKGLLNKKIEQKKKEEDRKRELEEKKKEEERKRKLEIERQNKQKEENIKKNSSSNKNTSKPYVYVNKNLGLQMTFPASWKGLYRVESDNNGIYVYVKPQQSEFNESTGSGFLFSITKKGVLYEDHMDAIRYVKAKGITYFVASQTGVTVSETSPELGLYLKLNRSKYEVTKTIKAIE